jgi:hypothetical protein
MTKRNAGALIGLGIAIGLSTYTVVQGQSTSGVQSAQLQTIGVPGASNSTPSLAAAGQTVAAVWTAAKDGSSNVYVAMSGDGGATFSAPTRVNDQDGDAGATNEQPPRVVISGSGRQRTVTVVWSKRDTGSTRTRSDIIRMARSTDGGRTFSPARVIHDLALTGARGWQSFTLGPDGTLHAVWLDGRRAEQKMADTAKHTGMEHKGQPPQELYHGTLSPDGHMIETLIASDVCFCCKTAVAVDARGTVYAAWRHIFPGSLRDIAFAKSSDGGGHFSSLVRVSEDKWELNGCPEDGPSMAVDQSGTIHIVWATVITEAEPQKAIFYATSPDGKVFSPRARVPTPGITTPGHAQLVLMPGGGAAVVFDEVAGGVRRVSLARKPRDGAFQQAEILSGAESASYPVMVRSGATDLLVAWTSRPTGPSSSSDPSQIRVKRLTAGL